MHLLSVGRPYNPARRSWPECSQYSYRGGQHELVLFFSAPTRHEVEAVRTAECEFGLFVEPPVLLVCYRFGSAGKGFVPWSDATFDWHKLAASRPAEATPPPWEGGSPELRAILSVVLVSAEDGIVRALRQVSFSPEFTRALHKAIWEQAHAPAESRPGGRFEAVHQAIYARHPTAEALAAACPVRTIGGV